MGEPGERYRTSRKGNLKGTLKDSRSLGDTGERTTPERLSDDQAGESPQLV